MARTILSKIISRKSNDESFAKIQKTNLWCNLKFETICVITKYRNSCGGVLISLKVVLRPEPSLKTTFTQIFLTFCHNANGPKSKTCHIIRLFWLVSPKFPETWNNSRYVTFEECQSIISIFILQQNYSESQMPIFLKYFPLLYISIHAIGERDAVTSCTFLADQYIL